MELRQNNRSVRCSNGKGQLFPFFLGKVPHKQGYKKGLPKKLRKTFFIRKNDY